MVKTQLHAAAPSEMLLESQLLFTLTQVPTSVLDTVTMTVVMMSLCALPTMDVLVNISRIQKGSAKHFVLAKLATPVLLLNMLIRLQETAFR